MLCDTQGQDLERRSKAALSVVYLANAEHVRTQLRKEGKSVHPKSPHNLEKS